MTTVMKGGFSAPSSNGNGHSSGNGGTEFMSMLAPPKDKLDGYDTAIPCRQQTIAVPSIFTDAMAVREEVYGEQGVPLEAEFDEDDARSYHWVAYASVASTSNPPKTLRNDSPNNPADDVRRASASASRMPVATIRLIPPPHGPNKYVHNGKAAKHTDADPPADEVATQHPSEPYVKLGRLAVLAPYRKMGLAGLLLNAVFDFAKQNPDAIYKGPSATAVSKAQITGFGKEQNLPWDGLVMIHAQANLQRMWEKQGFNEEVKNEKGDVIIKAEPHWIEEGIEHVGMWKRLEINKRNRLGSVSN